MSSDPRRLSAPLGVVSSAHPMSSPPRSPMGSMSYSKRRSRFSQSPSLSAANAMNHITKEDLLEEIEYMKNQHAHDLTELEEFRLLYKSVQRTSAAQCHKLRHLIGKNLLRRTIAQYRQKKLLSHLNSSVLQMKSKLIKEILHENSEIENLKHILSPSHQKYMSIASSPKHLYGDQHSLFALQAADSQTNHTRKISVSHLSIQEKAEYTQEADKQFNNILNNISRASISEQLHFAAEEFSELQNLIVQHLLDAIPKHRKKEKSLFQRNVELKNEVMTLTEQLTKTQATATSLETENTSLKAKLDKLQKDFAVQQKELQTALEVERRRGQRNTSTNISQRVELYKSVFSSMHAHPNPAMTPTGSHHQLAHANISTPTHGNHTHAEFVLASPSADPSKKHPFHPHNFVAAGKHPFAALNMPWYIQQAYQQAAKESVQGAPMSPMNRQQQQHYEKSPEKEDDRPAQNTQEINEHEFESSSNQNVNVEEEKKPEKADKKDKPTASQANSRIHSTLAEKENIHNKQLHTLNSSASAPSLHSHHASPHKSTHTGSTKDRLNSSPFASSSTSTSTSITSNTSSPSSHIHSSHSPLLPEIRSSSSNSPATQYRSGSKKNHKKSSHAITHAQKKEIEQNQSYAHTSQSRSNRMEMDHNQHDSHISHSNSTTQTTDKRAKPTHKNSPSLSSSPFGSSVSVSLDDDELVKQYEDEWDQAMNLLSSSSTTTDHLNPTESLTHSLPPI